MKIFAKNKKANYLYTIIDKYEAGIVLSGTEVKSIISNNLNISDSFAVKRNNEVYLINMHISPYKQGNITNLEPLRTRKLLLHKYQIQHIFFEAKKNKLAVIVLQVYENHGKIKIEIALAKSKKIYDKRETMKKRSIERELNKKFKRK